MASRSSGRVHIDNVNNALHQLLTQSRSADATDKAVVAAWRETQDQLARYLFALAPRALSISSDAKECAFLLLERLQRRIAAKACQLTIWRAWPGRATNFHPGGDDGAWTSILPRLLPLCEAWLQSVDAEDGGWAPMAIAGLSDVQPALRLFIWRRKQLAPVFADAVAGGQNVDAEFAVDLPWLTGHLIAADTVPWPRVLKKHLSAGQRHGLITLISAVPNGGRHLRCALNAAADGAAVDVRPFARLAGRRHSLETVTPAVEAAVRGLAQLRFDLRSEFSQHLREVRSLPDWLIHKLSALATDPVAVIDPLPLADVGQIPVYFSHEYLKRQLWNIKSEQSGRPRRGAVKQIAGVVDTGADDGRDDDAQAAKAYTGYANFFNAVLPALMRRHGRYKYQATRRIIRRIPQWPLERNEVPLDEIWPEHVEKIAAAARQALLDRMSGARRLTLRHAALLREPFIILRTLNRSSWRAIAAELERSASNLSRANWSAQALLARHLPLAERLAMNLFNERITVSAAALAEYVRCWLRTRFLIQFSPNFAAQQFLRPTVSETPVSALAYRWRVCEALLRLTHCRQFARWETIRADTLLVGKADIFVFFSGSRLCHLEVEATWAPDKRGAPFLITVLDIDQRCCA